MSDLVERLRKRAEIRRSITTRKSVQEGKPDRIADLLEEAAGALTSIGIERDHWKATAEALSGSKLKNLTEGLDGQWLSELTRGT